MYPGGLYVGEFTTSNPTTGAAQNADSLPAASAVHNGAIDGSFTLTVTNLGTGLYKISGTIPTGYAVGDTLTIVASATVASVAGVGVVQQFTLQSVPFAPITVTFIMRLSSDGRTPAPGKTVSGSVSIDGVGFVSTTNAPGEIGFGYYFINLTTADQTCTSNATFRMSADGCDDWSFEQLGQN